MAKPSTPAPSLSPGKLSKRMFFEELEKLTHSFSVDASNPSSYSCRDCERCTGCMFCERCRNCYRCNHCEGCVDCNQCTHAVGCNSCHASSYCVQCELCSGSAYLAYCRSCSDCTYCFGCVGLSKKDFYILNVPYSRREYFEITKALKVELGIR